MKIFEYKDGKSRIFQVDKDVDGELVREAEVKQTSKPYFRKDGPFSPVVIGDVIFVNKFGANSKQLGFFVEILSFDIDNGTIQERLSKCNTQNELDGLRLEIASDKVNFLENQKLFIAAKKRIKNGRN